MADQVLTYRFRVRDKHCTELRRQAKAVNFVWNFCNETQKHALKWGKKWPTAYELQKLCAGSSKELGLLSSTIDKVCEQYEHSRRQHRKQLLRWRGKKSLGWIPLRDKTIRFDGTGFVYRGKRLDAWITRPLQPGQQFKAGSLAQDALGHWYINLAVIVETKPCDGKSAVGIDLGLKDLAVTSDGLKVEAPRWYRNLQERLAVAQRANKKRQAKALQAKAANRRADHLHKLSTTLVREHGAIFVGDVNAAGLAKTRMAKSVYDAGWSKFRSMLAYKAIGHGVLYQEVDEAWSTQTCNACGVVAGPKGRAGLNERKWTCPECGAEHDRDTNAARNILARGLAGLAEGARS